MSTSKLRYHSNTLWYQSKQEALILKFLRYWSCKLQYLGSIFDIEVCKLRYQSCVRDIKDFSETLISKIKLRYWMSSPSISKSFTQYWRYLRFFDIEVIASISKVLLRYRRLFQGQSSSLSNESHHPVSCIHATDIFVFQEYISSRHFNHFMLQSPSASFESVPPFMYAYVLDHEIPKQANWSVLHLLIKIWMCLVNWASVVINWSQHYRLLLSSHITVI